MLAAALHTKYLGPSTAWLVVSNHELYLPNNINKQMDEGNNGIGIALANECACSDAQIIGTVKSAIIGGQGVRYLSRNSGGNWTSSSTLIQTSGSANDESY